MPNCNRKIDIFFYRKLYYGLLLFKLKLNFINCTNKSYIKINLFLITRNFATKFGSAMNGDK